VDFSCIAKIIFKIQITESMRGKTLADIDETFIATGNFLEGIINDPLKSVCLKSFVECQDIINWLREFTNSRSCIIYSYVYKYKIYFTCEQLYHYIVVCALHCYIL